MDFQMSELLWTVTCAILHGSVLKIDEKSFERIIIWEQALSAFSTKIDKGVIGIYAWILSILSPSRRNPFRNWKWKKLTVSKYFGCLLKTYLQMLVKGKISTHTKKTANKCLWTWTLRKYFLQVACHSINNAFVHSSPIPLFYSAAYAISHISHFENITCVYIAGMCMAKHAGNEENNVY